MILKLMLTRSIMQQGELEQMRIVIHFSNLRMVPDDKSFIVPKTYKQPLKSYLKQCGCLVTNRKYLIASFKTRIHIWKLDETNILASINTNHQLIGQIELRKNILGKKILILFVKYLLNCKLCYIL